MPLSNAADSILTHDLIEASESLPLHREVHHCGESFSVSPFAIYAECPVCRSRIKVRAFSAATEPEDVFDAVFTWMNQPGAQELVQQRQQAIAADSD